MAEMKDYGPVRECAVCGCGWHAEYEGDGNLLCSVCRTGKRRVSTMIRDLIDGNRRRTVGMLIERSGTSGSEIPIRGDYMGSIIFESDWGRNGEFMERVSSKLLCKEKRKFFDWDHNTVVRIKELY